MNPLRLDVDRIVADARRLAFPRYPGTAGGERAMKLVESALAESGLEVRREEFSYDVRPAFRALRALLLAAAALVAAAGWLAEPAPGIAAVLLVTALAGGGLLVGWAPWLERIYRRPGPTRTANLYARRPAATPRLSLVLLAHHDSKSQNLTLPVRAVCTLLALGGALALAGLLAAELVADAGPAVAARWSAALSAAALAVLSTLRSGNRSPGGVDNAGSLAIVLELARRLPDELPPDVDLWLLAPGAEEDHMVGAMRWLDRHLGELAQRPVWAINLDGAGIPGRVSLLERYGFGQRFSPRLSRLARRVAAGLGIAVRGVLLPPAMGVDAIPFAHRGVPCLTLASGSLGRAVLAVHSAGDTADNLDRVALEQAARLAAGMALELAQEKAPGR